MKNPLKSVRVALAVLIFVALLLFFCDFAGVLPKSLHTLAHLQVIPAILTGTAIFLCPFILTFLFGRIYCSTLCPLGVLQDIISRLSKWIKSRRKRNYKFAKPKNLLRYSILILCAVFLAFGNLSLITLFDPYSNFGRIATNIFRPIAIAGNNLINWCAVKMDNFDFYHVGLHTVTWLSFLFALLFLLLVGIMAYFRGRLFCNTLCPVGSLLGLFSQFSLFRIRIDESTCTSCGRCEKHCKSQCINSKAKTIDSSRCVTCFNCIDRCKQRGIRYRFAFSKSQPMIATPSPGPVLPDEILLAANKTTEKAQGMSRRSFFAVSSAMAATLPFVPAFAQEKEIDFTTLMPITPPGSQSLQHFKSHCTACHLCITHCPQQALKPAGFEYGVEYAFKPHLSFYTKAFCNYECTVCSEICPNGAIRRLTTDEKKITQVGVALFNIKRCKVYTDDTACGACSEHCPTQAVRMVDYKNGLTIPQVEEALCIGCGGCESICSTIRKAIKVKANEIHQIAEKPQEEEELKINQDELEFGF